MPFLEMALHGKAFEKKNLANLARAQNSVGVAYGLGDYNPHWGTGLGERNALTIGRIAWG